MNRGRDGRLLLSYPPPLSFRQAMVVGYMPSATNRRGHAVDLPTTEDRRVRQRMPANDPGAGGADRPIRYVPDIGGWTYRTSGDGPTGHRGMDLPDIGG